tara:strand:- start:63 stop:848 length:786 start_codon:yes stop_codon:yes gene_type:complete
MKKLIPFLIALISSPSWAWTLVYSGAEGFPTNEITINVASTNSCSNAGLTASSLLTQLETSIDKFWNQVSESALVLKIGELKSIDIDGDSLTAVANKADNNTILVGCNDDISSFSGGWVGAVGGISCTSTYCKGAVIVNAHSNTNVDTYSENTLQSLLAHEIGHAIGLGHSSVEEALMYYSLSAKTHDFLHQDDMNGISWLYPNEDQLGGLGGSCATIDVNGGGGPKGPFFMALTFIIMILSLKGLRVTARRLRPRFHFLS